MTDQEIKAKLQEFGLSQSQALIYLLLVKRGELRIQEIVEQTATPRSTVYESLKSLFEHGLVEEIVEDSYKLIRPYPISAIRHGLDEKIYQLEKLTGELTELEKALTVPASTKPLDSVRVRYYKGVPGARQLFWNTLKTQDTVYVYSAFGRSKFVGKKFYTNFVRESYERRVKEKVLINPTERALGLIRRDDGSSLARTKVEDIRALSEKDIFIKGETFIYGNIYAQVYLDTGEMNGFEIESSQFVETQRSTFETLWRIAQPVSLLLC